MMDALKDNKEWIGLKTTLQFVEDKIDRITDNHSWGSKKELAEQEQKESAAREHNKEEKLKNFALQEAPQMWQTYVTLGESIESQAVRLEELRKTLESVEQDPSQDRDYATLVSMRDEMIKSRDALHEKIKQAYLQYSKFLATPGNAELKALHKKTMEDGVREAEATMKHYREMTKEK